MNEFEGKDGGNQFGNLPSRNPNQEGKSRSFILNAQEHFNYSSKTLLSFGALGFLFTIIVGTLNGYRSAISDVDKRIYEVVPSMKYDNEHNLFQELTVLQVRAIDCKERLDSQGRQIGDIGDYLTPNKGKKK